MVAVFLPVVGVVANDVAAFLLPVAGDVVAVDLLPLAGIDLVFIAPFVGLVVPVFMGLADAFVGLISLLFVFPAFVFIADVLPLLLDVVAAGFASGLNVDRGAVGFEPESVFTFGAATDVVSGGVAIAVDFTGAMAAAIFAALLSFVPAIL